MNTIDRKLTQLVRNKQNDSRVNELAKTATHFAKDDGYQAQITRVDTKLKMFYVDAQYAKGTPVYFEDVDCDKDVFYKLVKLN